jgi:hypothetical protein
MEQTGFGSDVLSVDVSPSFVSFPRLVHLCTPSYTAYALRNLLSPTRFRKLRG